MVSLLKAKLALLILGALTVTTAAGAVTVVAARDHAGPFATNAAQTSFDQGGTTSAPGQGGTTTAAGQFHAQGAIVSVALQTGSTTIGSLIFLPNGQTKAVTVTFTAATHIEVNGPSDEHGSTASSVAHSAAALAAGMSALVEGATAANGSVAATEIQANANGAAHQQGDATPEADHHLSGTIQSVGTGTFALTADTSGANVTIAFDAATKITLDSDANGAAVPSLSAGQRVEVVITTRADGTLYAKEIDIHQAGTPGADHATPTPEPGGDQPESTPTPGNGHDKPDGTPTPHP